MELFDYEKEHIGLLRDSLAVRFDIRSTDLGERISLLKPRDKEVILDVVALLVKHAQK